MSSTLGVHEEEAEHEVYGAEIPFDDDDAVDSFNSELPKEEKLKDLEKIQKRFKEIEHEAEILREKQTRLEWKIAQEKAEETCSFNATLAEKKEVDSRSIYVGNVDYDCLPEELQVHFNSCGTVNRVTILTNELGMPKGFAYVEFAELEAVQAALALNQTVLHGRHIKVAQKRTNVPGMKQFQGYPYPDPYIQYEYGPVHRMKPYSRYTPY
ncbi:hypothetical protein QQ045_030369 [Rhodiola kirilowii]